MRNTWNIINSIIRTKSTKSAEKFVIGDKTYTCPVQIASEFNNYFSNIGSKLASTIHHSGNDFSHYLNESTMNSCFFRPTNEDEILKIIMSLGNGKSAGHDGVKPDLLKKVANEISYPLPLVFNMSLSTGTVPDDFKIAKVVPIYKKDSPDNFGNYRPVSVLPCMSKILERIVYNRSYEFLCKNNILFKK